ncbi:MAG: hypothetical protein DWG83_01670 [Chloroflexi bacterium]|nr:hypothetical protein [Chloroflexota bacterium]MDA1240655.1 hypothetical protein [Chloroflexota bacterium]MQC19265.1 hypothetical protein [Chloroflexota bacterium]
MSRAIPTTTDLSRAVPRAGWTPMSMLRRGHRAASRLFNRLNGLAPAEIYAEDVDELLRPTFT